MSDKPRKLGKDQAEPSTYSITDDQARQENTAAGQPLASHLQQKPRLL